MFTWAQPGSGMFKLISEYNPAGKRNPNKLELSTNVRKITAVILLPIFSAGKGYK